MPAREGNLKAPTRHPVDWRTPDFYDPVALDSELARVFDICHGCRRCLSLCNAFPTLFDLIDESPSMEVDGVPPTDYAKVVEQCYLCDLCYMTKCPYVPPHEWNVDFPHLMLRAKAVQFSKHGAKLRDRMLTSTDATGRLASLPVVVNLVNAGNRQPVLRRVIEKTLGVAADAKLPEFHRNTLSKRLAGLQRTHSPRAAGPTTGSVALVGTCYGERNDPQSGVDLVAVLQHNGIDVQLAEGLRCCGMPKLELGDLKRVEKLKQHNIPRLATLVDQGCDLLATIPSCVLMFKKELPLLFPEDTEVQRVAQAFFDPFEYLLLRHKAGRLNTEFRQPLGKVAYQAACHQRVQNIGARTRAMLELVPDTEVTVIERCSGHDGTYAVKRETRSASLKIARPVVRKVKQAQADHFCSDCPMAASHIASQLEGAAPARHPVSLIRHAYGL